MKKNIKIFISWVSVIAWYGIILYFSSIPNLQISTDTKQDETLRVPAHLIEYGILSFLLARAYYLSFAKSRYILIISIILLLTLLDEYWQSTVPTRTLQIKDLVWDNVGALLVLIVLKWKSKAQNPNVLKN